MANGKIRGVTIEIGADVSGLQKSLSSINSSISSTQKQLKDVEKLLKLDPTNTELLAQKQKLLNKSVEEYSSKLQTLKSEQSKFAEAAKSGNENAQKSYDALQREIISVTDYLDKAKKSAEEFNSTTAKIQAGLSDVGTKAKEVADKTKALSVAGAAAATALGAMAYKSMQAADDLNTLAQQSGLTTEEIQKFQYAAELVDVSTEDIISSLKKMRKNMDSTSSDTQEAWAKLGISVKDSNGEFRDSIDVFYQTLQSLSQVRNETERDILAMQLFGKNADQLAGIIDDGGASLKAYGEQAKIWSQESIDAANEVNDLVEQLKSDIVQEFLIAGAKALEAYKPVIEGIAEALTKVLDVIGSLSPELLGVITTVAVIVASISPIASIISNVTKAVNGVIGVLPKLINLFGTLNAKTLLIVAALTILVGLIAAIADAWADMTGLEKVVALLGTLTAAALGAAMAMGAFQSAATMGIAAAGIAAGIAAVIASIEIAKKRASESSIPMMASGGTLSKGSAIVGEAGAELLTVNNGKAVVTPLTNNNTTYNTYNQTSGDPIQVNLMLDKTVLAREMVQANARAVSLAGGSCIK